MRRLVSVLIPALNEAATIERSLRSVAEQTIDHEILVVDGGSSDETARIARRFARVVESPRGRARQMNAGAAAAQGDVLLFLHADTTLPANGLQRIREALTDPSCEGGTFRLRFDAPTPLLRLYGLCTRFPIPKICFGDRSLFVRSRVFDEIGGFPDLPLFEDLEMVQILHRRGGFVFLDDAVTTSARRFRHVGPLRQQLRNACLWLHYMSGSDPHRLTHRYPYDHLSDE